MSVDPGTPIPAGWYPAGSFQQRWWTGTSWTNDFAQYRPTLIHAAPTIPHVAPVAQPQPQETNLYVAQQAAATGTSSVVAQSLGARTVDSQRIGGTPSFGQTSTLTRDLAVEAPQATPTPFTLPAADRAPQTTVAQPNAGNATLIPVARTDNPFAAVGENRAFSSEYLPFSSLPAARRGAHDRPERRYTAAAWSLAFSPLLLVGAAFAVASFLPLFYTVFVQGVLAVAYLLVVLLLAMTDRRSLSGEGHDRTASPSLALLTPPIYLLVRSIFVTRETGRSAFAPFVLVIVTVAAIGIAVILLPGVLGLVFSAAGLY
jgi:hypothetical protein